MKEWLYSCVLSDDSNEPTNSPDKIRTVNLTCSHPSPSAELGRKVTVARGLI